MSTPKAIHLSDCGWYKPEFLKKVEKEIQDKAFLVQTGMDTFSASEQLAYMVLQSQGYFEVET